MKTFVESHFEVMLVDEIQTKRKVMNTFAQSQFEFM